MDTTFRPLNPHERDLLERLLEREFPGREELRQQLKSVAAKQIFEDGTLDLQCGPSSPAPVRRRVPTEGECVDADGVRIHVLLHVVNGAMNELEIFKDDSSIILSPPTARDLVLFTPYGEAGVNSGNPVTDGR
jgi:hypothetical protein